MQIKQRTIQIIFIIIFSLVTTIFPSISSALTLGALGIIPSQDSGQRDWFIYNLKPGITIKDRVVIFNTADEEQEVFIQSLDATIDSEGSFSLSRSDSEQKFIGKWIKHEKNNLILAPQERKIIEFTVSIPENINDGEYTGAISIQKNYQSTNGTTIKTRVATRIYITIYHPKIIKGMKNHAVYLIENGKKRPFLNANAFESLEYKWTDIATVSEKELKKYPLGETIRYLGDGDLVKSPSSPAVFLIMNNTKFLIPSERLFKAKGFRPNNIIRVTNEDLLRFSTGNPLEFDFTDEDRDGLSFDEEVTFGTNPTNDDTDYDGYLDGEEIKNSYDPLSKGDQSNRLEIGN